jgi:hypothetical protein
LANWCSGDTSDHDWLEGRGPLRYLVRMIDDAISWSWGRFIASDATPQNIGELWEYLEENGRMVDVYTDRASMNAASGFFNSGLPESTQKVRHSCSR